MVELASCSREVLQKIINNKQWSYVKFWKFPGGLTSLLFSKIQWNNLLRAKAVVILDTGNHLMSHPTYYDPEKRSFYRLMLPNLVLGLHFCRMRQMVIVSKSQTSTEVNFAQIEKETLEILLVASSFRSMLPQRWWSGLEHWPQKQQVGCSNPSRNSP